MIWSLENCGLSESVSLFMTAINTLFTSEKKTGEKNSEGKEL